MLPRPLFFVLFLLHAPAHAGYFDCAVVYDEFESLMNKNFLTEPDRFVSTVSQRFTKSEFETLQKGQFLLYEEREDMGIAIFRTNNNLSGKFLFRWSDPLVDGQSYLVIEEGVMYSRVEDGYGPSRIGPYRIKPGAGLDLDTGQYDSRIETEQDPDAPPIVIDLRHGIDPASGQGIVEAANEARLHFPVESLCSETSQ